MSQMDGWMDVRVLHPFNSISVISRRWKGEHERLCAMKRRLGSGRILFQRDSNPRPCDPKSGGLTARPCGRFGWTDNVKTIYPPINTVCGSTLCIKNIRMFQYKLWNELNSPYMHYLCTIKNYQE